MELIRRVLLSKYLGLIVRHFLTALGTYLIAKGIATPEQATEAGQEASNAISNFISSPDFTELLGSISIALGFGSGVTKAKIVDAKNEEKLEFVNIDPVKH